MNRKLSTLFVLFIVCTSMAQNYNSAIGFKGNYSTTHSSFGQLTWKQFFSKQSAFELTLGGNQSFVWGQFMYERNQRLNKIFEWYWGAGIDAGYFEMANGGRTSLESQHGLWSGVNGVLGIEHTFAEMPINVAFDFGPTVRITPDVKVGLVFGLSMRYAFGRRAK